MSGKGQGKGNGHLKRRRFAESCGPNFVKLLTSTKVAGSIIGKGGKLLTEMQEACGVLVQISPTNSFFPGTSDRVVVIGGPDEGVRRAIETIILKMYEAREGEEAVTVKLAIPNSAASAVIGRGGEVVRALTARTSCRISLTDRSPATQERIVQIAGDMCNDAALAVYEIIQTDSNLAAYTDVFKYDAAQQQSMNMLSLHTQSRPQSRSFQRSPDSMAAQMAQFMQSQEMAKPGHGFGAARDTSMRRVSIEIQVNADHVGRLIGKGGEILRDISNKAYVKCSMTDRDTLVEGTNNRRLTVTGYLPNVQQAHTRIEERLAEIEAQEGETETGNLDGVQDWGMGHPYKMRRISLDQGFGGHPDEVCHYVDHFQH